MSKRIRMAQRLRRAVKTQPSSGLNISAYCREHKIPLSTFMLWRKRIRYEMAETTPAPCAETNPSFVRIIPETRVPAYSESCELSFPDGRILRFPASFPLESLLAVLKGAAA